VDSSVAAALLLEEGYQVIGMMMRLWSEAGQESHNRCCTPDAMAQARRVAAILGIPFYAVDAQQIFFDTVVRGFIEGYTQGITPNPCLICNQKVRWGYLLDRSLELGAQYLATGHYVRLGFDEAGLYQLLRAVDQDKDQSYVLHMLSQKQLSHSLFPLGDYTKSQVRQLARGLGLPVAERVDSQDLCFLGDEDYRDFLLRYVPEVNEPGPILTLQGEQLGQHKGLAFFTIGQRKGIGVPAPDPLYVLNKDYQRNALIVGKNEELGMDELYADGIHWISGQPPTRSFRSQVKIRYKAQAAWGIVSLEHQGRARVQFDQSLRDITPGQAAVFYANEVCLGGGVIQ
jgi:tRNA-specific 2-thiouridylase